MTTETQNIGIEWSCGRKKRPEQCIGKKKGRHEAKLFTSLPHFQERENTQIKRTENISCMSTKKST